MSSQVLYHCQGLMNKIPLVLPRKAVRPESSQLHDEKIVQRFIDLRVQVWKPSGIAIELAHLRPFFIPSRPARPAPPSAAHRLDRGPARPDPVSRGPPRLVPTGIHLMTAEKMGQTVKKR
jgi:hypothetical protein